MAQAVVGTRYARSSRLPRRGRVALGAAGVLALTAVVSYIGLRQAAPPITATVVGFHVTSEHAVDVRFQVDKTADRSASCVLRARSSSGEEVGRLEVPVAAGARTQELTATVKTSALAIVGEVSECRLT